MLLLLLSLLFADPPKVETPKVDVPKVEGAPKKLGEYKKFMNLGKHWSENITNLETYKNYTFKAEEAGKEIKFVDLDKFRQKLFIVMQFETMTNNLEALENELNKDLSTAKEGMTEKDEDIIQKGNIEQFLKDLKPIRQKIANQYETYMEEVFKEYKGKFSEKEMETYMKELKKFHDDRKLVERNK